MSTFEQATPINTAARLPQLRHAVKARLGSREGEFVDLWIGVPVKLDAHDPPVDGRMQTTHYKNGAPQRRTVLRWGGSVYQGASFSSWCADYIGTVNGFWNNKLRIVHNSVLSSGTGLSHEYPTVRCCFHAYQSERPLKRILVTAVPPDDHPTSSCVVLGGGSSSYAGGIAEGYDSLLDSNDLNERPRTARNGEQTNQIAVVHEMGHYIGLRHRCRDTTSSRGRTPADVGQGGGPRSDATYGVRGDRDSYCERAQDGALTHDVMAAGMVINPWHAYVWKQVWDKIEQTHEGTPIPSSGWVEQLAEQP